MEITLEAIISFIGLFVGGFIGVSLMCLMAYAKDDSTKPNKKDETKEDDK